MRKIIFPHSLFEELKLWFNTNKELTGYFLGETLDNGIRILHGSIIQCNENSASIYKVPKEYLEILIGYPSKYELFSFHAHSRKYGEIIRPYDPYWTITHEYEEGLRKGE